MTANFQITTSSISVRGGLWTNKMLENDCRHTYKFEKHLHCLLSQFGDKGELMAVYIRIMLERTGAEKYLNLNGARFDF